MKRIRRLVASAGLLAVASCGGGGSDSPAPPADGPLWTDPSAAEELEQQKKEQEEQKAAEAAMAAPAKVGEFLLTITPSAEIREAYGIKVHVLSVNEGDVAQYRTMGADNYWKSPSNAAQIAVFGTSGKQQPVSFRVPSRDGADTVLVIAKLPGAAPAHILDYPLKRQPGPNPLEPVAPRKRVNLSRNGLLPY